MLAAGSPAVKEWGLFRPAEKRTFCQGVGSGGRRESRRGGGSLREAFGKIHFSSFLNEIWFRETVSWEN